MCNAWNHRIDCTCGWGGTGHTGRRSASPSTSATSYWPAYIPPITGHIASYINPNAQCPVCGAPVFYYCNENGSSVFFDELGPPWPKHPCTNNSTRYAPQALEHHVRKSVDCGLQWVKNNWSLYSVLATENVDSTAFKVFLKNEDAEIEVFIPKSDLEFYKYIDIFPLSTTIFLNRNLRKKNLSLLSPMGKVLFVSAYDSLLNIPQRNPTRRRRK